MDKDQPKLGQLLPPHEYRRDAIHIAIAPVTAGHDMKPGTRVGLHPGDSTTQVVWDNASPIGVVDPFLTETVKTGERFWLFLFPNTITGLRHVWSHPAFTAAALGRTPNG